MKFGYWFIINSKESSLVKSYLGLFGMIILAFAIISVPLSANAQTYQQIVATSAGTLKVGVLTDPASPKADEQSKLKIDFLNPQTNSIQEHIDYTVSITNDGAAVFGPIQLTHTSLGTATIPVQFKNGENKVVIDIQGILFRPVPSEKASFSIMVGDVAAKPKAEQKQADKSKTESPPPTKDSNKNTSSKSKETKSKDSKSTKATKTTKEKSDKKDVKKKTVKKTVKKPVKKNS